MDDIIELYLYLNGKRQGFPRSCLSSSKLKCTSTMNSAPAPNDHQSEPTRSIAMTPPTKTKAIKHNNRDPVLYAEISNLRISMEEMKKEMSALRVQVQENYDLKSEVKLLKEENRNMEATIVLLASQSDAHCSPIATTKTGDARLLQKANTTCTSRDLSWTLVNNNRQAGPQTQQDSSHNKAVKAKSSPGIPQVPIVMLANCFDKLSDEGDSEIFDPTPEEIIDRYYQQYVHPESSLQPRLSSSPASCCILFVYTGPLRIAVVLLIRLPCLNKTANK